jgi:hypothetical protein
MGQHHNRKTIHPILNNCNCYNTMGSMPHDFVLIVAPTVKEDSSLPLALYIFIDHNLLSYSHFQRSLSSNTTLGLPKVTLQQNHIVSSKCQLFGNTTYQRCPAYIPSFVNLSSLMSFFTISNNFNVWSPAGKRITSSTTATPLESERLSISHLAFATIPGSMSQSAIATLQPPPPSIFQPPLSTMSQLS